MGIESKLESLKKELMEYKAFKRRKEFEEKHLEAKLIINNHNRDISDLTKEKDEIIKQIALLNHAIDKKKDEYKKLTKFSFFRDRKEYDIDKAVEKLKEGINSWVSMSNNKDKYLLEARTGIENAKERFYKETNIPFDSFDITMKAINEKFMNMNEGVLLSNMDKIAEEIEEIEEKSPSHR